MSAIIPESIRELAAGYALGALTAEETEAFAAALAQSPELRREVAEYHEVNALLATARTERPAPDLKERLIARVGREKVVAISTRRSRSTIWFGLAAAASLALAVGLGSEIRRLNHELGRQSVSLAALEQQLERRERTLNTLLTAESDLTVLQLTTAGAQAPGMQFFWNRRSNVGVLHAFRLTPAADGKVYQLWLIVNGKPIPSATFNSGPDGHALVNAFALPAGGGFEAAAVTLEPSGGSQTPTMPILMVGKVAGR